MKFKLLKNWVGKYLLSLSILVLLGLVIYWPIFQIFYLQEEWLSLGHILAKGNEYLTEGANMFQLVIGKNRLLARVLGMLFWGHFRFQIFPVSLFNLTLHLVNSVLVFFLAEKIFKKKALSLVSGLFFLLSSVSSNTVFWSATSIGTLPATTFVVLSLFGFMKTNEGGKRKYYLLTFLSLYVSLFFKDIGFYLFLLFPLLSLHFVRTKVGDFIKKWWYFLLFFAYYVLMRVLDLKTISTPGTLFIDQASGNFLSTIAVRTILYPLTSFSLQFFPPKLIEDLSRNLAKIYYPYLLKGNYDLIVQTVVMDILAVLLSSLIFILVFSLFKKIKKIEKKYLILLISFCLMSFLPYVVIGKSFAYLESRYYYLSLVAGGIIFSWIVNLLIACPMFKFSKLLCVIAVSLLFLSHLKVLTTALKEASEVSGIRMSFISQLRKAVPTLNKDKNIFYITSDKDYYIIGNKLPFQQGVGYMLMVLYWEDGKIPAGFLKDDYLFVIGSQGYRELGDFGFGYFSDKNLLDETVLKKGINRNNIYAYYYDSKTQTITSVDY